MPRRSFRPSRRSGPKRKLVWARANIQPTVYNANNAANLTSPDRFLVLGPFEQSLGASTVGCTIIRTRGTLWTTPSGTEAVQLRWTMRVGDDSDATDITTADNAFSITANNRDYFLYEPFTAFPSETASATDLSKRLIDVKSSRKLEELNQALFLEISGLTLVGADAVTVGGDLSMLLMLP